MTAKRHTPLKLLHVSAALAGTLIVAGYLGWFWYTVASVTSQTVMRVASVAFSAG